VTPQIPAPPPFETRCPRCKVSYPIETRRCVHCGGPTERPAAAASAPRAPLRPAARPPGGAPAGPIPPPPAVEEEADEEIQLQRRGFTRGIGLLWVVLALAASIYRACTGEGGPG
jgi:hypothetical protein